MSDDLLKRATRALREQAGAEPSPEHAAQVRARVLAPTKRRAQLRPQSMWQWAAVVCLGFFVSTAMAHVIRVQLPRVIEALREHPSPQPKAAAPKLADPAKPAQPKAAAPTVVEPEPAAPSVPTEELAPAPSPRPPAAARRKKQSPRPPVVEPVPSAERAATQVLPEPEPLPAAAPALTTKAPAAESGELMLFRRAQSLHLARDAHAIEAWDAYLRVAGSSALAPEARYNRALGLVRAKRFTEAKRALAPFAEGAYGAYRRQEAQALLARLAE